MLFNVCTIWWVISIWVLPVFKHFFRFKYFLSIPIMYCKVQTKQAITMNGQKSNKLKVVIHSLLDLFFCLVLNHSSNMNNVVFCLHDCFSIVSKNRISRGVPVLSINWKIQILRLDVKIPFKLFLKETSWTQKTSKKFIV